MRRVQKGNIGTGAKNGQVCLKDLAIGFLRILNRFDLCDKRFASEFGETPDQARSLHDLLHIDVDRAGQILRLRFGD